MLGTIDCIMTDTPMMQQYNAIKTKHTDAILFFRLGDFYEMFNEDARQASQELGLTLTGRGKSDNRIPMCGVPHHAAENYISKLVTRGYKVAICEQMEEASASKGPTKREVVRIITPGTVQLDSVLTESQSNYLVAICNSKSTYGLAYLDISTGEFKCDVFETIQDTVNELHRLDPSEVLVDDGMTDRIEYSCVPYFPYNQLQAEAEINHYFGIADVAVFNIQDKKAAFPAIVGILQYVTHTNNGRVPHITRCQAADFQHTCRFDQGVINHLDIFSADTSLFSILNQTKTPMGARLLRHWIRYPLIDCGSIQKRQKHIQWLMANDSAANELATMLSKRGDLERLLSKVCSRFHNPKDMIALRYALQVMPRLTQWLSTHDAVFAEEYQQIMAVCDGEGSIVDCMQQLNHAFLEDVPGHIRDGGIFRSGFSQELDALCSQFKSIRDWMMHLEPTLRETLGIKSLKVSFNKVFGYTIEVPNSQLHKVPSTFIRKQTLANAERFITSELKEKEAILLSAKDEQSQLEKQLYLDMVVTIQIFIPSIQLFAQIMAYLDVVQSLSSVANRYDMTCPIVSEINNQRLVMTELWHPMVAKKQSSFIKNNISLSQEAPFLLITGPNMAGKSTVMRSVAIAIILGQMGAMVPADMAEFSIVDQLFTRIGANDKLSAGQSTFMVEMVETATICHNATASSLILLDEIGRGTSTFDGISIAASVSEFLIKKIGARILFATHYHELTDLSQHYSDIRNACMQIKESNQSLVFTYQLISGAAEKSYGVTVAKMAGLPQEIIDKAEKWLQKFEQKKQSGTITQLSLFD